MSKNFIANDSQELYLFDLELASATVNQGLAVDEDGGQMYASQVYNELGGRYQSFVLTRTSLGGKKIDSMIFKNGGHGTSFGIEKEGGKVYIWTNMLDVDSSDNLKTQWLCRVPYLANTTISISDSRVQKIKEFPNAKRYQSPFTDPKNGLIALRITDTTGSSRFSELEVYNISDVKKGNFNNKLYTYKFTATMNESVLQGLALDNTDFYVTFGQSASDFHLFRVNLTNGSLTEQIKRPFGYAPDGAFVEGFGEPEGLFLYTDPNTGFKTLLTVIVGDAVGRRRQRLFALSSNVGVQKFIGLAAEAVQRVPLTRPDNKAKRVNNSVKSISEIMEPGSYYMTTVEGDRMTDHPMKGVAGWWLYVSGGDSGNGKSYGRHQILARNSGVYGTMFVRTVSSSGKTSPWFELSMQKK
ncbi:hypothetical protein GLV94_03020 [Virgibacillus halodenitrificans]|uniref:phage baseplate protein n=1 Tax=Virgibacillus halodenitrificans TaxID=1482 RepID=UPI00136AB1AF|nr:hypothetical protein [Virgibacillus halodenitrificans]MYL44605.1 hypothetical protein [Virgibacillus halodenitrificans]